MNKVGHIQNLTRPNLAKTAQDIAEKPQLNGSPRD